MSASSCCRLLVLALAFITATSAAGLKPTSLVHGEPVQGLHSRGDSGGRGIYGGGSNGDSGYNNGDNGGSYNNGGGDNGGNGGGYNNPTPSQRPRPRAARRMASLSPSELAESICPYELYGCPIAKAGTLSALPTSASAWTEQGFECVDLKADLRACGGCPSLDNKYDCTSIEGADDIACVAGQCVVDSCHTDYTLDSNNNACNRK